MPSRWSEHARTVGWEVAGVEVEPEFLSFTGTKGSL